MNMMRALGTLALLKSRAWQVDNASTLVIGHIGQAIATSTLCASVYLQTLLLVSDWSISASWVEDESS